MLSLFHRQHQIRWLARLAGLLTTGWAITYQSPLEPGRISSDRGILVTVTILVAVAAYIVAWRREAFAGTAMALAGVMLGGLAFAFSERDSFKASLALGLPWFVSGLLFVLCSEFTSLSAGRPSR